MNLEWILKNFRYALLLIWSFFKLFNKGERCLSGILLIMSSVSTTKIGLWRAHKSQICSTFSASITAFSIISFVFASSGSFAFSLFYFTSSVMLFGFDFLLLVLIGFYFNSFFLSFFLSSALKFGLLTGTRFPTGIGLIGLLLRIGTCLGKMWIGYLWMIDGTTSINCLAEKVSRGVCSGSIWYFWDDFDFLLNVSNLTIVSLFSMNFSFMVFLKFFALESI